MIDPRFVNSSGINIRRVTRSFRWDSETQHHIPQLILEFEPVPANSLYDAPGWEARDALAKIIEVTTFDEAQEEQP